jgi:hypothetical protein
MGKGRTKVTVRPTPFALAEITVIKLVDGVRGPFDQVKVLGIPGRPDGQGGRFEETSSQGVFRSAPFPPGRRTIRVIAPRFGPADPSGGRVRAGEFSQEIDFLPTTAIQEDPPVNRVTVVMQAAHPVIRVTVSDVSLSPTFLADAEVEVIGTSKGRTDAFGVFVSGPVALGNHDILVRKPGFVPEAMDGDAFFQRVEIGEGNRGEIKDVHRDLRLNVSLLNPLVGSRRPLPGTHSNPITIWASGGATPHSVNADPRLPAPGGGRLPPSHPPRALADTPQGQDGWDLGINYGTTVPGEVGALVRLSRQLEPGTLALPDYLGGGTLGEHQVKKLAIVAHGAAGVMDVDQVEVGAGFGDRVPDPGRSLTVARLGVYQSSLERIGRCLHRDSVVYLIACRLAEVRNPDIPQGEAEEGIGELLLKRLSLAWPTTKVVAIRTLAVVPVTQTNGFPGLRATRHFNIPPDPKEYNIPSFANDLAKLPWFTEDSPHATVARDGNIIRRGLAAAS